MAHILEEKERTRDVILKENITFEALLLQERLMSGLSQNGYVKPSPIQLKSIPIGRCGFDLIIKSKSGTGKTLVFAVLALEMIDTSRNAVQVLILAPTREIAVQIQSVVQSIGVNYEGLKVESFIGGLPIDKDIEKLKSCHIAVGAPGRVKHLIDSGALKTDSIRLFVLDEADKLMDNTFSSDINDIYHSLPVRKQMVVVSATYADQLDEFLTAYMQAPTHVSATSELPVLLGLRQFVVVVKSKANAAQQMKCKNDALVELLSTVPFTQCLVFTNYQTRAESTSNFLNQKGWNSTFISGAQSQVKRLEAYAALKEFKCRVLLSTDLTARGIDVANVDVVVNYDVPCDAVVYLHRMGRAGRYGSKGICVTIASEGKELQELQRILGCIGGVELAIGRLRLGDEFPKDVWDLKGHSLEMVYGVLDGDVANGCNDIKNSVFDMKVTKNDQKIDKKSKKKTKNSRIKTEPDVEATSTASTNDEHIKMTPTTINKCLQSIKQDNEIEKELAETDLQKLLQSMANADVDETKFNEEINSQPMLKEEKLSTQISNVALTEDGKSKIALRNVALLNVCKTLVDDGTEVSTDASQTVKQYLSQLKSEEDAHINNITRQFITESPQELLQNLETFNNQLLTGEEGNLEKVFSLAYASACGKESKHWLSCFSDGTQTQFKEYCEKEAQYLRASESESEEEMEYIEQYEDDSEEQLENPLQPEFETNPSQVLPETQTTYSNYVLPSNSHTEVNPSDNSGNNPERQVDNACDEHFVACFDECSNMLANSALTFENVPSFDDWFGQWQQHLQDVRIYVQQNIYVSELSRYQQAKRQNK